MGRHDASVKGRHTLPLSRVEQPVPRARPRVRNDAYNGAVNTLTAVLTANLLAVAVVLGLVVMMVIALGPKEFVALVIILFAIFCFRRRK